MLFAIQTLVEERRSGPGSSLFTVRPLFRRDPIHIAEKLSRALTKLSNSLQSELEKSGRDPRHDDLAQWLAYPVCESTTAKIRLELDSGSHLREFFFATYAGLGRTLCFTPHLPNLHFEMLPEQTLADRAAEVLTRHFRDWEKDEISFDLDEYSLQGTSSLMTVEIGVNPSANAKKAKAPGRALLFGAREKKDGEGELRQVGRPLHAQYPDDLERAVERDNEVAELARLLAGSDRRPILLVGPRLAGKTAIVHELAWQIGARKEERFGGKREIWLVSPMRLISGMSYLGEWENRVLAILDHAEKKDKALYFDDLLGLFSAGKTSASDLSVAQVIRSSMEKRRVRVLAEITPEALRILRERDRAFAELFHIIPVNEPSERETLRILVSVVRQLEQRHRCQFDLSVAPLAYDLHRRFVRDASFPGKAAVFLQRLAARFSRQNILAGWALQEFQHRSGMRMEILDRGARWSRDKIVEALRRRVAGQDAAVTAFADVAGTLKARLNDPKRPLGVFLMLGPTGVGKTESAKALAETLFGNEDRLLRFDMNEYITPGSAARLCGNEREPDGLLTGAVRRQPFSVVLFDEIEKASPEVFDTLLAVLDEGRLADGLGRVADFTFCIILLTSNLGARGAGSAMGFRAAEADPEESDRTYIKAAERFFRPEFFNRLDRVIPFCPLSEVHLAQIARHAVDGVLSRDGLRRRECSLDLSTQGIDHLVKLGHDPQLGARALKRAVERELAQPLAEKLAAIPTGVPSIARVTTDSGRLAVHLRELTPVARSTTWIDALASLESGRPAKSRLNKLLDEVENALARISRKLDADSPSGKIDMSSLSAAQARYFYCREQLDKVEQLLEQADRLHLQKGSGVALVHTPKVRPVKSSPGELRSYSPRRDPRLDRQKEHVAFRLGMAELKGPETVAARRSPLRDLLLELALLEAMTAPEPDDGPFLFIVRDIRHGEVQFAGIMAILWRAVVEGLWGGFARSFSLPKDGEEHDPDFPHVGWRKGYMQMLYLSGPNLRRMLPSHGATALIRYVDGGLGVLNFEVLRVRSPKEASEVVKRRIESSDPAEESVGSGSVIYSMTVGKSIVDHRSGFAVPYGYYGDEFRASALSTLPLPPEIEL